jgi:hypothetical protein
VESWCSGGGCSPLGFVILGSGRKQECHELGNSTDAAIADTPLRITPIVRTLGDAVDLIDEDLPETLRFRSSWREVKEMLVTAAEARTSLAVETATTMLEHALEDEGWLD